MMLFESSGYLQYHSSGWILLIPHQSIGDYYNYWVSRYLLWKHVNKPMHGYHITVVAGKYEDVRRHSAWMKHHGKEIPFKYDPIVCDDQTSFWLTVYSRELEELRLELDLYPFPRWPFHLTVANLKNL